MGGPGVDKGMRVRWLIERGQKGSMRGYGTMMVDPEGLTEGLTRVYGSTMVDLIGCVKYLANI